MGLGVCVRGVRALLLAVAACAAGALFGASPAVASSYQIQVDGPAVDVAITQAGETATLTFDGIAGQRVSVHFTNPSGFWGGCCGDVATLAGPFPATTQLAWTYVDTNVGQGLIEPTQLSASGQYTITFDPAGTATGTVRVRLYAVVDVTADFGAPETGCDGLTFTSSVPGTNARISFTGGAGQLVSVQATGSSFPGGCCSDTLSLWQGGTLLRSVYTPGAGYGRDGFIE